MPISILYIVGNLDIGGTECHIVRLLPLLDRRKFNITVFCILGEGTLSYVLKNNDIQVSSPISSAIWNRSGINQKIIILINSIIVLIKYLNKNRPDIVHYFLPFPYIVGGLASLFSGVKKQIMSRRSKNNYQNKYPGVYLLERFLHSRMSLILANSNAIVNELVNEGVMQSKIKLIYNGVTKHALLNVKNKSDLEQELGILKDGFTIVIVANLIKYKGHKDLLLGLSQVSNRLHPKWTLVCCGSDSFGLKNSLIQFAKELNIMDRILFLGPRNDIPQILQLADISVLPSHEEGFSNAILEAMISGLPSIVSNVGGNAEAIRHEIDGLVVEPHNPNRLGEAIAYLCNNKPIREKMGENARIRATSKFSMKTCVKKYELYYSQIEMV